MLVSSRPIGTSRLAASWPPSPDRHRTSFRVEGAARASGRARTTPARESARSARNGAGPAPSCCEFFKASRKTYRGAALGPLLRPDRDRLAVGSAADVRAGDPPRLDGDRHVLDGAQLAEQRVGCRGAELRA